MQSIENLYPLLYYPLKKIEVELNKQISLDLHPKAIKQSSFELLSQVERLKKTLNDNFLVTNVNFQQIVRNLYQRDNTLELIKLDIQIKDCESYSRIACQQIPLHKFKIKRDE